MSCHHYIRIKFAEGVIHLRVLCNRNVEECYCSSDQHKHSVWILPHTVKVTHSDMTATCVEILDVYSS
jgi:hypothetical protein